MYPRNFRMVVLAFVVTIVSTINTASSLQVEFFSQKNYSGFIDGFQSANNGDCIDMGKSFDIKSIRTDKCLMLYDSKDCTRMKGRTYDAGDDKGANNYYSYRIDKSTPEFKKMDIYHNWNDLRKVQSFHVCSKERGGGPSLDVDYYDNFLYDERDGKLVKQWRDVCTCQNVPAAIIGGDKDYISINNHGNDMELFSEEYCKGRSEKIYAGDNRYTRALFLYQGGFDVKSFRPAGLINCIKLDARIYEFHFKNGSLDGKELEMEKVKLAVVGEIVNDGPAETSEEYTISEKVTETVEFSIATGYTETHSAGAEVGVEVKVEAGVPLFASTEVTTSVTAKYQYTREDSNSNTTTNTVSTETTLQVTKRVTVPGCNSCTVNGYVKQAKNFPIDYDSYSRVSGTAGGSRLRADELKGYLPAGLEYIRDYDEFTVEASASGTMFAQYGVNTLFEVKCDPIPDCKSNAAVNEPTTVIYEMPFERVVNGKLKLANGASTQIGWSVNAAGKESGWNTLSESFLLF